MSVALYRNPRAWRARLVQAACWIAAAALLFLPLNAPPMTSADAVVFAPSVVLVVGAVIVVEVFLRRYVLAIHHSETGVVITTLTTFAQQRMRHARQEIVHAGHRRDRAQLVLAPSVDNSWIALRTKAGEFAYVVDVTPPATIDDAALRRALG